MLGLVPLYEEETPELSFSLPHEEPTKKEATYKPGEGSHQ